MAHAPLIYLPRRPDRPHGGAELRERHGTHRKPKMHTVVSSLAGHWGETLTPAMPFSHPALFPPFSRPHPCPPSSPTSAAWPPLRRWPCLTRSQPRSTPWPTSGGTCVPAPNNTHPVPPPHNLPSALPTKPERALRLHTLLTFESPACLCLCPLPPSASSAPCYAAADWLVVDGPVRLGQPGAAGQHPGAAHPDDCVQVGAPALGGGCAF